LLSDRFHFKPPEVLRTNGPRTPEAAALAAFLNRPQAVAQIGGGALFCAPKAKNPFSACAPERVSPALAAFIKRPQAELGQIGA
jgi:hypothetical protein